MNFKLSWGPWSWDRIISTEEIIHLYTYHGEGKPEVCGAEECPIPETKKSGVETKTQKTHVVVDKQLKMIRCPDCDEPVLWRSHFDYGCPKCSPGWTGTAEQPPDPLHPDGKCTCADEGTCEWCLTHCIFCGSKTEGARVRGNIAAYLRHVASVEVGTILSPASRVVVGWCAAWVENRLDEKWLKDKLVPLPTPPQPPSESVPPNSEVGRLHSVREGGVETRKLRYMGNGRWQVTPVSWALWHEQGGSVQSWKRDDEG